MRHGNSRVSRAGNRRGNSGNDDERDPRRCERLRFLRAASEDEWIAALKSHDAFSSERFLDQKRIDFLLREGVRAGFLACVNDLRVFRCPFQHLRVAEVIVDDHLRLFDALFRPQRDQAEIPRPGAHEAAFSLWFLIGH